MLKLKSIKPSLATIEKLLSKQTAILNSLDIKATTTDKRFEKMDERFVKMDKRFEKMDERFVKMDKRFEKMDERFVKMDKRFEKMDERFVKMDKRFEKMDERFVKIEITLIAVVEDLKEARIERNQLKSSIDKASDSVDRFIVIVDKLETEFTIIKEDLKRVKMVLKKKLGVDLM